MQAGGGAGAAVVVVVALQDVVPMMPQSPAVWSHSGASPGGQPQKARGLQPEKPVA